MFARSGGLPPLRSEAILEGEGVEVAHEERDSSVTNGSESLRSGGGGYKEKKKYCINVHVKGHLSFDVGATRKGPPPPKSE